MTLTDMHSHIAWHLDDGCQTIDETRTALETAREDGITKIISTPHILPGRTEPGFMEKVRNRQGKLKNLAAEYGIDIIGAGEIRITQEFLNALKSGWLPRIGDSKAMLVEFNVRVDFSQLEFPWDPLYEMRVMGIQPVLAHPERYFHGKMDWNQIEEWANMGVLFQINATSLSGLDTKASKNNAWQMLERGYAHFIASDAHSPESTRQEKLHRLYDEIEKRAGKKAADALFHDNQEKLLKGIQPGAVSIPKQSILKKWFR